MCCFRPSSRAFIEQPQESNGEVQQGERLGSRTPPGLATGLAGDRVQNENAGPWLKNDQEFRTATAERSTKCGDTCAAPTQPALNLTPNEFITVGTSGREMKGQGPLRVCDSEGTRERFEGVTFALDQIEGKR